MADRFLGQSVSSESGRESQTVPEAARAGAEAQDHQYTEPDQNLAHHAPPILAAGRYPRIARALSLIGLWIAGSQSVDLPVFCP